MKSKGGDGEDNPGLSEWISRVETRMDERFDRVDEKMDAIRECDNDQNVLIQQNVDGIEAIKERLNHKEKVLFVVCGLIATGLAALVSVVVQIIGKH